MAVLWETLVSLHFCWGGHLALTLFDGRCCTGLPAHANHPAASHILRTQPKCRGQRVFGPARYKGIPGARMCWSGLWVSFQSIHGRLEPDAMQAGGLGPPRESPLSPFSKPASPPCLAAGAGRAAVQPQGLGCAAAGAAVCCRGRRRQGGSGGCHADDLQRRVRRYRYCGCLFQQHHPLEHIQLNDVSIGAAGLLRI